MMTHPHGLRLEYSDDRSAVTEFDSINAGLVAVGSYIWPIDLGTAPGDIRKLLQQPSLAQDEIEQVMAHFMLPRERLLELIAEAGRKPQVPGGGDMSTYVSPHNYSYPQLFVVEEGIDYSRFDRLHVNVADDGTGVDEFMHILCGTGVRVIQRLPGGGMLTLHIDCPSKNAGWIVTYDGAYHHIGSLTGASTGSKVLMQVIGPPHWVMQYEDDAAL